MSAVTPKAGEPSVEDSELEGAVGFSLLREAGYVCVRCYGVLGSEFDVEQGYGLVHRGPCP